MFVQLTIEDFADNLSDFKIADLSHMQTNKSLLELISNDGKQVGLDVFAWTFARPMLREALSSIADSACNAFIHEVSLHGLSPQDCLRFDEGVKIIGDIFRGSNLGEFHIRYLLLAPS